MKKAFALLLAAIIILSLCACGTLGGAGTSADVPEDMDELAAGAMLKDILAEMSINLHEGDAGCSLTASAYAGRILDLYAAGSLTLAECTDAAREYLTDADAEISAEFPGQLSLVYSAAIILCSDNSASALEISGYEAESYPWNAKDTEAIFAAIYEGVGLVLPD